MMDFLQMASDAIAAERQRQIEIEGHDFEGDSHYQKGELLAAGECYIGHALQPGGRFRDTPSTWPWASEHWKPRSLERDLVRGAALLVAERDQAKAKPPSRNRSELIFSLDLRINDARRVLAHVYRDRHEQLREREP